ncbi:MAG: divergent polysaccharide deacetylase family protein [Pseudomonadales bacterium]
MNRVFLLMAMLLAAQAMADVSAKRYQLVIVMDDLGYSLERAERVLALPGAVTLGLLPFAPDTAAVAARAAQTGHETILHQPMEPLLPPASHAMRGTLTLDMSAERFGAEIEAALGAVPGIVGVNNHTGSRLTQDPESMRRLMRHLANRDLLFLDSRTTAATVAYTMAREARIPALQRDVFLDHQPHPEAIAAAFQRALSVARRQGHAVIIAHPHHTSLTFLEDALARLPDDFELVALRDLAKRPRATSLSQRGEAARPEVLVRRENPATLHRSLGR